MAMVQLMGTTDKNRQYIYSGDKLTDAKYKDKLCFAVLRPDGKCITCKMAKMLVEFENGERVIVLRRRLKKTGNKS